MGADMIVTTLVIDKDKEPDFDAGHTFVAACDDLVLTQAYENIHGEPPVDEGGEPMVEDDDVTWTAAGLDAGRKYFHDRVDGLRKLLTGEKYSRDMVQLFIRGAWVYLTGGLSWGDSPTEDYDLISDLGYLPGLNEAMGFETEPWPSPEEVHATPTPDDEVETVQVAYLVPLEVVVNVKTGTVERVVEIIEGVALDEKEGVRVYGTLVPVSKALAERAIEIADGPHAEWPAWEAG